MAPQPVALDSAIAFEPLPTRRARCADGAGTLAPLFFSDDDVDIARAKAVCRSCSLRVQCLAAALERKEAYGVWGGTLLIDGEPTRFARRRGRPARDRVEIAEDEVPIPAHLVA
ncbi:MAG: WhiB family transcriptional regulator [Ilumatobacter sp.]|uniref:WhiB family transcriptional regulator n=1 Tax=Ilumatobacter sp. TaxID=1967498 RepID=UPI003919AD70